MKFFYTAGSMGFGKGYLWHKFFKFPKFPIVTKTITLNPKRGNPFAILHLGNSIWNKIALHNIGIQQWLNNFYDPNLILSVAGTDEEILRMIELLGEKPLKGLELNFSCPNVKGFENKSIPDTKYELNLKLNYKQNPYDYDLTKIKRICLNSIPYIGGGMSGRLARKLNWDFIIKFKDLPVVGASFVSFKDLQRLSELGCREIAIGTVLLINPFLVTKLR